ncbi:MAG: VanW family protein [Clostridia bacterium]|nr:VanW family protein [Clostridia bacterium]
MYNLGDTFSFCNTVGKATADEGYQKADIFDSDGNIVKGYGGGNCQISSTLYNVVLNTPNLTIIERHAHSRKVDYVETGKDAAVSYGSVDFKFRNDNDYSVKIYASNTSDSVDIKIVKL